MNEKIARFLETQQPATPCLVVDIDIIRRNYTALAENLPRADVYYAVKANPAPQILTALVDLGANFDAASYAEVELCLAVGASPAQLSYGNTVKKQSDIAKAFKKGVDVFCFDSKPELNKLADAAPGARVLCRIIMDSGDAQWPLSQKFGCAPEIAVDLLTTAKDMGLHPYGISFHVGSQQINPRQWIAAIEQTASLFADATDKGLSLETINLGGGFPANYRDDVPDLDRYSEVIMAAMTAQFGNSFPRIIIEPGRGISGDAGVIQSEVVLVSRKSSDDEKRWVYLDVGKFGGLPETADELIQYRIRTPHDGGETGPVIIAGPTCDDLDILYNKAGYTLPLALQTGDKIEILSAGAYTATYASVGFNGFPPLDEYYI